VLQDIIAQLGVLGQGSDMEGWIDLLVILGMAILWAIGGLVKVGRSKAAQRRREGPANAMQRAPRESWQQRLARKAEEMQRAAEARGKEMARRLEEEVGLRQQGGRPARPTGRIAVRQGPRGESIMVYEEAGTEPATEREQQAARQREARKAVVVRQRQAKEAVSTARRHAPQPAQPIETMTVTELPGLEPMVGELTGTMREPPRPLEPSRARPAIPGESAGFEPAAVIDYRDPDALKKAILHYEILGNPVALRESSERMPAF
jgi:hypothetical protein